MATDLTASGSGSTVDAASLGAANSGEVEDYQLTIVARDFGDAPDTASGVGAGNYETLTANGGPSPYYYYRIGDWGPHRMRIPTHLRMVRMPMSMRRMMMQKETADEGAITFTTLRDR